VWPRDSCTLKRDIDIAIDIVDKISANVVVSIDDVFAEGRAMVC